MLPGMELMNCPNLAVPLEVMHHVVRVESSYNPYAIGVVGGQLARQPKNLAEALSTVRMLEGRGYNFSVGLAQVNRYNLARYGLRSYDEAFQPCANLQAGSRILAECHERSRGDWGKSFSCYYSGNFVTGFRHGYVQKVYASMHGGAQAGNAAPAIDVIAKPGRRAAMAATGRRQRDVVNHRISAASPSHAQPRIARAEPATLPSAEPAAALPGNQSQPVTSAGAFAAESPTDQAFVF